MTTMHHDHDKDDCDQHDDKDSVPINSCVTFFVEEPQEETNVVDDGGW